MDGVEKAQETKPGKGLFGWKPIALALFCAMAAEAAFFWSDSFWRTVVWAGFAALCSGLDALPHGLWRMWILFGSGLWGWSVWASFKEGAPKWVPYCAWLLPLGLIWPGVAVWAGIGFEAALLWTLGGSVVLIVALLAMGVSFF